MSLQTLGADPVDRLDVQSFARFQSIPQFPAFDNLFSLASATATGPCRHRARRRPKDRSLRHRLLF